MLTSLANLNSFAGTFVERAASVAWQWAVLVVVLALPAQWLLRSHAPALRYWVWQVVLFKLLLMPLWTYALPVAWLAPKPAPATILIPASESPPIDDAPLRAAPVDETVTPAPAPANPAEPTPLPVATSPSVVWSVWLIVAWSAIVVLQILRLIVQRHRLARLLTQAISAEPGLIAAVREAANLLGLSASPRALLTAKNISPFVCGTFRPTLVLPDTLASSLSETQLRQVLLHELAHIRRRDLLWGWIPQITRTVWFFHPVVHWVVYRLRLERELACDQLAMALSGRTAADYAQTLVDVVTQTSQAPPYARGGRGGSQGKQFVPNCAPSTLNP